MSRPAGESLNEGNEELNKLPAIAARLEDAYTERTLNETLLAELGLEKVNAGKTKILLRSKTHPNDGLIMFSKDNLSAGDGLRKEVLHGKGILSTDIDVALEAYLQQNGIRTQMISRLSPRSVLVESLDMIPLEVVVRFVSTGSHHKRVNFRKTPHEKDFSPDASVLESPIVEFFYKNTLIAKVAKPEKHNLEATPSGTFVGVSHKDTTIRLTPHQLTDSDETREATRGKNRAFLQAQGLNAKEIQACLKKAERYEYIPGGDFYERVNDPLVKFEGDTRTFFHPDTNESLVPDHFQIPHNRKRISDDTLGTELQACGQDADQLAQKAEQIFQLLQTLYAKVGLTLFDGKIEFGVNSEGEIVLGDIIDGDSCRIKIVETTQDVDGKQVHTDFSALDKDGFRVGEDKEKTRVQYLTLAEYIERALMLHAEEKNLTAEQIGGLRAEVARTIEELLTYNKDARPPRKKKKK